MDKSKGETEEFQALRKDDAKLHVEVSTSAITDDEGYDVETMASFVNIADRKNLEKAIKESFKKIKLFAYSISHELKSRAGRPGVPNWKKMTVRIRVVEKCYFFTSCQDSNERKVSCR